MINEQYGAAIGDAVLQTLARVMQERLRETDVIARIGDDEFAVMLPEMDAVGTRRITTELVRAASERSLHIAGASEPMLITVSAGIELFGPDTLSGEDVLSRAALALAEAKEEGPGLWVVYDGGVRDRRRERNSRRVLAERVRAGLESDAFLLDAQPIVEVDTGQTVQYELLLRLRDDDGSVVRPNAFMAVAERYGLMRAIDEWVVRRAIALSRARLEIGSPVTLSVNLSKESVTDPAFVPLVISELLESPDVAQHLVFEITESAALENVAQTRRFLARTSELGCRFALDQFAASTSFGYLRQLPVDYVKLAGELTRGLPGTKADKDRVTAAIAAARGLGKQVVASAVEDEAILASVRGFGVELAQGLHVGRPERASLLLAVDAAPFVASG